MLYIPIEHYLAHFTSAFELNEEDELGLGYTLNEDAEHLFDIDHNKSADIFLCLCAEDRQLVDKLLVMFKMLKIANSFDEYQYLASRTAKEGIKLSTLGLGVAGESGEIADYIKKIDDQGHELDKEVMAKEIGDVLWYLAALCDYIGISFDEVAAMNIDKLKKRYPDGFSSERSINREEEKPSRNLKL